MECTPHLEIEKSDLYEPRVKLNYEIKTEYSGSSNIQLEIQIIKYRIILESSDPSYTDFTQELDLGESYTYIPMFIKIGIDKEVSLYFNIPTKALRKILDLLTKGRTIVLKIPTEIHGKIYQIQNTELVFNQAIGGKTEYIRHNHPTRIILPNQDVEKLIKDSEYPQILRIDVPLYDYDPKINGLIKGAFSCLQSGADEFEKGNIRGVLVDTRNAVTNHLTQIVNEKNKKKRVLNIALKNDFLARAPTNAHNIYKNVIDNLQNELLAALEIIHKFVHEESDKLKMMPMREDLELTYYSVEGSV